MAVNEPILASQAIHGVKPDLDLSGNPIPCKVVVNDATTPVSLVVDVVDKALRDLGKVDAILQATAGDALQTVVAAGAQVDVSADRYGRLKFARPKLSHASSSGTPITSATGTDAIGAPAANFHLRIWRFHASNSGATSTWVYLRDGAAGTQYYPTYLPTNGVISIRPDGGLDLTTATKAVITTSAAGNVEWHIEYETVAD